MAHITLPDGLPGIRGPMAFRPETAKPLNELVDVLLRGPHSLSPGERELIATFVSARNECFNLANHANFGLPVADLNSPNFGRILSAGPARLLQFGVKLLF